MWIINIGGASAHVPGTDTVLIDPKLTKSVNAADKLEFTIPADHPMYSSVLDGVFSTSYEVMRDDATVSRGRVLSRKVSPLDASCKVVCEGELAYLADAVMPEYDFAGSPTQLIEIFLEAYAEQADEARAVEIGRVTAYDGNDYIVRGNESPSNLLSELLSKTCDSSTAGYIQIRNVYGTRYLDWLATLEYAGEQEIVKGSNLLDISDLIDGGDIVTAIMPLGSKEDGAYVKLPDEPDGQIDGDVWRRGGFVYSKELVSKYGWHATTVKWEDVTRPANLKTRAVTYVSELSVLPTFELAAVDLSDAGYSIAHLDIGQRVAVKCDGIDETVMVTGATWEMDDPRSSKIVFGKVKSASRAITENGTKTDGAGWSHDVTSFLTHVDEEGTTFKPHRTTMWGVTQSDMDDGSDPPTYDGYPAAYISVQQAESGQWEGERGNRIAMRAYDISMLNDGGTIGATSGDVHLAMTRMDNDGDNLALFYGSDTTPTQRVMFDADGLHINGYAEYNGEELGGGGTEMVVLHYGSSTWAEFIAAYQANAIVYCRASSNSNPATGSQTRHAFMAYVNNEENPTNVEFQYYRSIASHTESQQGDQVFVYKLDKTAGWSVTTREAKIKIAAGAGLTQSFAGNTLTLSSATGAITRYLPVTYTCTSSDFQLACTSTLEEYDPLNIISTSGSNILISAGYIVEASAYSTFQGTATHQNAALTIYAGSAGAISSQSQVAQAFTSFWSSTSHFAYVGVNPVIIRCTERTYISLAARSTTGGATCLSGAAGSTTSTLPSTVLTVKIIGKI